MKNNYFCILFQITICVVVMSCAVSTGLATVADSADSTRTIDTTEAWNQVAGAREAAEQNQHHDAVSQYLAALEKDARLVPLVAQEIAYQKLWREDAEKSIFYFQRYLARHPEASNHDVRRGLALAYSWSGRQPEAIALYRELAAEDGRDGAARVGLGRCLIWDNELAAGWRVLRHAEDDTTNDPSASTASSDLILVILDSYSPPLEVGIDASWDSDNLNIARVKATAALTIAGNKLLQIIPVHSTYRQNTQPQIHNVQLGVALHTALRHNVALHAFGWFNQFTSEGPLFGHPQALSWLTGNGDFWVTWLATPRLRWDIGGSSLPVETFFALNNHLHFEQANVSADYRLGHQWRGSLAGSLAHYSDGNNRQRGSLRFTWRHEGTWELHAGPVFTTMNFSRPYPGGYWAPNWVRNGSLEATLKTRRRHWTWRLGASLGREKETDSQAVAVGGASFRVGWRCRSNWLIAAETGHSRSSFSSASGFNRTFLNLSARAFF